MFQKEQVIESIRQSFVKLNPRMMIKNPIMFTVEVVTELLMQKLNEKNLLRELSLIISEGEKRDQMLAGYDEVNEKLGDAGASERFARMMIDELSRFRG